MNDKIFEVFNIVVLFGKSLSHMILNGKEITTYITDRSFQSTL